MIPAPPESNPDATIPRRRDLKQSNTSGANLNAEGHNNHLIGGHLIVQHGAPIITCPPMPPRADHFGGRDDELEKLAELITSAYTHGHTVPTIALYGMGGVGKTTLAKEVAHYLKDHDVFQIVIWANLGRNPDTMSILESWGKHGDSTYHANRQFAPSMQAQEAKARLEKAIQHACSCDPKRVLVVLDDVWDTDAFRLLSEAKPDNAMVFITTRLQRVVAELGAQTYKLEELKPQKAAELLHQYLDTPDTQSLVRLGQTLNGHALALKIASQRANLERLRSGGHLSTILNRHILQYQQGLPAGTSFDKLELDLGNDRYNSLTLSLAYSYEALPTHEDRARFRALGILAHAPFDLEMLSVVWNLPIQQVEKIGCDVLCQTSLLESTETEGIYRLHRLLSVYARALLHQQCELEMVFARYADYILQLADQFIERYESWSGLEPSLPHIDEVGNRLVNMFERDRDNLPSEWAERLSLFAHKTMRYVLYRPHVIEMGPLQERRGLSWLQTGIEVSHRMKQRETEALLLMHVGKVWSEQDNREQALICYKQAWQLWRRLANEPMQAKVINRIGQTLAALGNKKEALTLFKQLLPLLRRIRNVMGEAQTLNDIGRVHYDLDEYTKALARYEEALALYRDLKDQDGQATALSNIGQIWYACRDSVKALSYYEQALALYRETYNQNGEVMILTQIGHAWHSLKENRKAIEYYEHTLPVLKASSNKRGEATTLVYMGNVFESSNDPDQALKKYKEAISLYKQVGDQRHEAAICFNIGMVYKDLEDWVYAVIYVERCVELEAALKHPDLEKDRKVLMQLKKKRDEKLF